MMHGSDRMKILSLLTFLSIAGIFAQENAGRNIPSSLLECYNTTTMLIKDNRLPHNIPTLIAIIRKIENSEGLNMDLRTLSIALLHRFRQDGIELDPTVQVQEGIVPFSPNGFSFPRNAAVLRLVAGNAVSFPNNSLTAVERCTLHYMLSSSIEMQERGDENTVCTKISQIAQYTIEQDVEGDTTESGRFRDDIESIAQQEPALPSNYPNNARVSAIRSESSCPVENGVIMTRWGAVSAGPVLAGIAAALEPQTVPLTELMSTDLQEKGYASGFDLQNKWIATLAGDLAEVALRRGPLGAISVGAIGGFNSTTLPRWYFLTSAANLDMTTAEIRGDLDGMILADSVASWYSRISTLRLSQILDMYYSPQGVFNSSMRACNRKNLFYVVAPYTTMVEQAYSAALLLHESVAWVRIEAPLIRTFVTSATGKLTNYISTSMINDLNCLNPNLAKNSNKVSTHLSIILDTTWPFTVIQPFLATLLEGVEVGMYNSNFTIISGLDGSVMINSSNTLLDFYNFNSTQYDEFLNGFDLAKAIVSLQTLQTERLNREQSQNIGGGISDIVLILSYMSTITDTDREFCMEQLRIMKEEVPDAHVLYLTYGSKDRWSSLAVNSSADVFSITTTSTVDTSTSINPVISRIKEIPKRLINSACGASFSSSGSSASFVDYVEPSGINYYRLHPNYFSSAAVTVKVQGAGWGNLDVCTSRSIIRPNATSTSDVSCTTVTTNTHSITFSCDNADVISSCDPFYLSVAANTSDTSVSYQCTDATVCRYPDMRKYTISYENLICRSSASAFFLAPFIIIASFSPHFLN